MPCNSPRAYVFEVSTSKAIFGTAAIGIRSFLPHGPHRPRQAGRDKVGRQEGLSGVDGHEQGTSIVKGTADCSPDRLTQTGSMVKSGVRGAFDRGSGHGLLQLGAAEIATVFLIFFPLERIRRMLRERPLHADDTNAPQKKICGRLPPESEINRFVLTVPPMTGVEYLTTDVLEALWRELDTGRSSWRAFSPSPVRPSATDAASN
jgi:hypothetical protein